MEKILGNIMGDPEKMFALYKVMESLQLIMEIFPKCEVKLLKLKDKDGNPKEYIAILFERPSKGKANV
jgi:hypothetical protein